MRPCACDLRAVAESAHGPNTARRKMRSPCAGHLRRSLRRPSLPVTAASTSCAVGRHRSSHMRHRPVAGQPFHIESSTSVDATMWYRLLAPAAVHFALICMCRYFSGIATPGRRTADRGMPASVHATRASPCISCMLLLCLPFVLVDVCMLSMRMPAICVQHAGHACTHILVVRVGQFPP